MIFSFALQLSHAVDSWARLFIEIEDAIRIHLDGASYGQSVKEFVVSIVVMDAIQNAAYPRNKPTYIRGRKLLRGFGLQVEVEDCLEIQVGISLEEVVRASTSSELWSLLIYAMREEGSAIRDLHLEDFQYQRLLVDLAEIAGSSRLKM